MHIFCLARIFNIRYACFLYSRDFELFQAGVSLIVLKGKLERVETFSHFEPHIYHTGDDWTEMLDKGIYTVLTLSFYEFRPGMPSNCLKF